MKGSTHSIHLALGCAAVIAAAGACSHPSPRPSSPSGVGTSASDQRAQESTGGSNTLQPGLGVDRESQSTGQPGAMQQGQPSDMEPGAPTSLDQQRPGATPQGPGQPGMQGMEPGQPGMQGMQPGQPSQQGASPQGAQGTQPGSQGTVGGANEAATAIDERAACDRLTSEATLHIENVEGGVVIVARPSRGSDLSTLRSHMRTIEHGVERGAPSSTATQCDLFSLARTGVMAIAETPNSIRLLVTTSDASQVPQLRREASEFVRSTKGRAPQGGSRGGSPQRGGTPPAGTPRHGGETPQHGGETPHDGTP